MKTTTPLIIAALIVLSGGDAGSQPCTSCAMDPGMGPGWTKCTQTGTATCVSSDWSVVATLAGPTQNTCTFYVTGPVFFSLPVVRWTSNANIHSKCSAGIGPNVTVAGTTRSVSCISDGGSAPTTAGSSFTYDKSAPACK